MDDVGREIAAADPERFAAVVDLQKTRARTIPGIAEASLRYFGDAVAYDQMSVQKHWLKDAQATLEILEAERAVILSADPFNAESLEAGLRGVAEQREVGFGKVIGPLRVGLLGVQDSPGIFDVVLLLGRERAVERIDAALAELARLADS
jgi:glutamyl-tRNA synthetase